MAAMDTLERPRSRQNEDDRVEAILRLDAHEQLCTYRYGTIIDRVGKLEKAVYWAAATLLTGMAGVIATLLLRGGH